MAIKRRVMVYQYRKDDEGDFVKKPNGELEMVEKAAGRFCGFGVDYVEYPNGIGNYTTVIVEYSDGTLENVSIELARLLPTH